MHNQITNVTFLHSDLFASIPELFTFDLIVANPPYIAQSEWSTLAPNVTHWEDENALVAADNGLALIKNILKTAPHYLKNNLEIMQKNIPQVSIEIGYQQGAALKELMKAYHYTSIAIKQDSAHKDRLRVAKSHKHV